MDNILNTADIYDDLDWIIGSQTLDYLFDEAIAWLNSAPYWT